MCHIWKYQELLLWKYSLRLRFPRVNATNVRQFVFGINILTERTVGESKFPVLPKQFKINDTNTMAKHNACAAVFRDRARQSSLLLKKNLILMVMFIPINTVNNTILQCVIGQQYSQSRVLIGLMPYFLTNFRILTDLKQKRRQSFKFWYQLALF